MTRGRVIAVGAQTDGHDVPALAFFRFARKAPRRFFVTKPLGSPLDAENAVAVLGGAAGIECDHDFDQRAFGGFENGDLAVGALRGIDTAIGGTAARDGYTAVVEHFQERS